MWNTTGIRETFYMRQRKPKGQRKEGCSKCGNKKEESRKKQRYCLYCHAEWMKLKRIINGINKEDKQRRVA